MIYGYGTHEGCNWEGKTEADSCDYYLLKNSYARAWRNEKKKNGENNAAFATIYLDSPYGKKRLRFKGGGGYCSFAQCKATTRNDYDQCLKTKIQGWMEPLADGSLPELQEGTNRLNGFNKKEVDCVTYHKNKGMKRKEAKNECKRLKFPKFTAYQPQQMIAYCTGDSCLCPTAYKNRMESCCKYFESRLTTKPEEAE